MLPAILSKSNQGDNNEDLLWDEKIQLVQGKIETSEQNAENTVDKEDRDYYRTKVLSLEKLEEILLEGWFKRTEHERKIERLYLLKKEEDLVKREGEEVLDRIKEDEDRFIKLEDELLAIWKEKEVIWKKKEDSRLGRMKKEGVRLNKEEDERV